MDILFYSRKKKKASELYSASCACLCNCFTSNILDPYARCCNKHIKQNKATIAYMLKMPNTISLEFHNGVIQSFHDVGTLFFFFIALFNLYSFILIYLSSSIILREKIKKAVNWRMNDKESLMSKWKGFYWIEKLQGATGFHTVRQIQLP